MAKGQQKSGREKRKPKATEAKNKVPGYMAGSGPLTVPSVMKAGAKGSGNKK